MVNPAQFLPPKQVMETLGAEYGPIFLRELGGAPALVRQLIDKNGIDCSVDERPIIRCSTSPSKTHELERQASDWQALGANVQMAYAADVERMTGAPRYKAAILDYRGFTIQPLAYVRGLAKAAVAKGLRIATGTRVSALEAEGPIWKATVGSTVIRADKVILSTNALSDDLVPGFKEEIMPLGAFCIGTADPLPKELRKRIVPEFIAMWDTHMAPLWFRYDPEERLHVGSIGFLPLNAESDRWVTKAMKSVFPFAPSLRWKYRWSGTLGLTGNHLPHLVQPRPGIFATIGCNGRGIAPNTYFGTMLAKIALGEQIELPLPWKSERYPMRGAALEAYDMGTRFYRNTLILH